MNEDGLRAVVALFMKAHGATYRFYPRTQSSSWDACIAVGAPLPFDVHDFKELLQAYCVRHVLETTPRNYVFLVNLKR